MGRRVWRYLTNCEWLSRYLYCCIWCSSFHINEKYSILAQLCEERAEQGKNSQTEESWIERNLNNSIREANILIYYLLFCISAMLPQKYGRLKWMEAKGKGKWTRLTPLKWNHSPLAIGGAACSGGTPPSNCSFSGLPLLDLVARWSISCSGIVEWQKCLRYVKIFLTKEKLAILASYVRFYSNITAMSKLLPVSHF